MNILELSHVSKHFGSKKVLQDVTFALPEKCIFGFIGRNGAGKTTTMKSILGLIKIDEGEITICGDKVAYGQNSTNRYIGYLPDVPEFYSYMTAREYLRLCGEVTGMKSSDIKTRSDELLELVGLADEKHRIKGYSRGMKQRLGIAQALINRPRLLICDEPTSALDPVGRKEILDILYAAKEQTSVLFSTHILSDVEKISDRIALLEGGNIVISGTIDDIKQKRNEPDIELSLQNAEDISKVTKKFSSAEEREGKLVFKNASADEAENVLAFVAAQHIPIVRFERHEVNLEDLFMEVIGK